MGYSLFCRLYFFAFDDCIGMIPQDFDIDLELAKLVREVTEQTVAKIQNEQLGELFVIGNKRKEDDNGN